MKSVLFVTALLAGALGVSGLAAGEQLRPSQSNDPKKANPPGQEKIERLLGDLADRLQKMLDLQLAVHDGAKGLHQVIQDAPDKKPRPQDRRAARKLADDETDILTEATKTLELLEAEAVTVALADVLREVRKDMERLQLRLKSSDVGGDSQALEEEIIDALKDMISALKKR